MGGYKKAAVATCARAALLSLNTTGPMSLVTIRNGVSLPLSVRETKRASSPRQHCPGGRNGAPHSLSAPVQQGKRRAEGGGGRHLTQPVRSGKVPSTGLRKMPGGAEASRQLIRQTNRQITGRCNRLLNQRVVSASVPASTCCEREGGA